MKPLLSVIIVNYKVKHFLLQCLQSVYQSACNFDFEVIVIDNHSQDDSMDAVEKEFSQIISIRNQENLGFSKANNQGMRMAKGEFVLLLNPDTVVPENAFQASVDAMQADEEIGGLGIKMVDGKGSFLPESKRGLPSPSVAFYKIFGLSRLFPRSKKFGKYHLGHLSAEKNQEVEILAGAYMMMRKKALEEVGLLDETFFMYGEDIDLSYRLILGGYKNVYLAKPPIIHYKGESTKKGSLNYVFIFYQAMVIFARKHFSQGRAQLFSVLIHLAIYLRAGLAIVKRFFNWLSIPVVDFVAVYGGLLYLANYWEDNHRFVDGGAYPDFYKLYILPSYVLVLLAGNYLSGTYDKPWKMYRIVRGAIVGSLALLAAYGLVDEALRFSRFIIVLGSVWSAVALMALRKGYQWFGIHKGAFTHLESLKVMVVSNADGYVKVEQIVREQGLRMQWVHRIAIDEHEGGAIGEYRELNKWLEVFQPDWLIYDAESLSNGKIISSICSLKDWNGEVKIVPKGQAFIIGSNSIHSQGKALGIGADIHWDSSDRRKKFIADMAINIMILLAFPLVFILQKKPGQFVGNWLRVWFRKRTWVMPLDKPKEALKGCLSPSALKGLTQGSRPAEAWDRNYLKNKQPWQDFKLIFQGINRLA